MIGATKYIVLSGRHIEPGGDPVGALVITVEKHIKDGWQPQGGVCVHSDAGGQAAYQAMVK